MKKLSLIAIAFALCFGISCTKHEHSEGEAAHENDVPSANGTELAPTDGQVPSEAQPAEGAAPTEAQPPVHNSEESPEKREDLK